VVCEKADDVSDDARPIREVTACARLNITRLRVAYCVLCLQALTSLLLHARRLTARQQGAGFASLLAVLTTACASFLHLTRQMRDVLREALSESSEGAASGADSVRTGGAGAESTAASSVSGVTAGAPTRPKSAAVVRATVLPSSRPSLASGKSVKAR